MVLSVETCSTLSSQARLLHLNELTSFCKSKINDQYQSIELCDDLFIPHTDGRNEDDYNADLHEYLAESQLLHTYKISIGGGQGNNIEPCDLFWRNKIIHVKKNGGSSVLSHLFNQAQVAAQAWLDPSFRNQLRTKMKSADEECHVSEPFRPTDYEIVIAIINKFTDERPKIPFFSKVAICFAATNIKNLGYEIKLKNIEINK